MTKRKRKSQQLEEESVWSARNLIWGTLIVALLTGIFFLAYRTKATLPREYEGKVIDKWARYRNSELGSRPFFHLLVETRSGQRISVTVDQDLYYRVKVGTWIKKTQAGVELGQITPANPLDAGYGSIKCDFESSKSNV